MPRLIGTRCGVKLDSDGVACNREAKFLFDFRRYAGGEVRQSRPRGIQKPRKTAWAQHARGPPLAPDLESIIIYFLSDQIILERRVRPGIIDVG